MQKIITLWDREKSRWDSTVLTDGKKCFKLYTKWQLSVQDIRFYHHTQNSLLQTNIRFDAWIDLWLWKAIKEFEVVFLKLDSDIYWASDLITKKPVIVSEVTLEKWESLANYIKESNPVDCVSFRIFPLLKKIQEYISQELRLDVSTSDEFKYHPFLQFQINANNIKIKKVDVINGKVELIVTDICMQVFEFIQNNKLTVQEFIS